MAALVLGLAGGVLDTALLGHAWAACDIGINAAANSFTLVYLALPVLCVVNGIAAGLTFRLTFAALRGLRARTGLAPPS